MQAAIAAITAVTIATTIAAMQGPPNADTSALGTASRRHSLRTELAARLARGAPRVVCLGRDPCEYGIVASLAGVAGRDMLIIVPRGTLQSVQVRYVSRFDAIEPLAAIRIRHHGRPAMKLPLFIGRHLRPST